MADHSQRALITGVAAVAPNGGDTSSYWAATLSGVSGLRPISRFEADGYPVRVAGLVDDLNPAEQCGDRLAVQTDRWTQFALAAGERALADAKIGPDDIDHLSAHATSTPVGDQAEAIALGRLFTSRNLRPPVTASKALTGHGLSLSGVMQAAFAMLAIGGGFIPGNPHLGTACPECDGLELPRGTLSRRPTTILSNSSGFGGSNVCHVIVAPERNTD